MIRTISWIAAGLAAAACSDASRSDAPEGVVAQAASGDLTWRGYGWNVTTGGMAGVAQGDPKNVTIDSSGYLHLKISKTGTTWTAAELYSTTNLGFGTYQWQISGPIDRMDHTVVLGLSPYGPAAGVGTDGFDEIDTEFSWWNDELGQVNMDWGVYPATKAGTHEEKDFYFSLNGGMATTARMVWSHTGVVSTVMSGFVPLGTSTNLLSTQTYAPADATDQIPQQALPVLLNLWCYEGFPASGNDVEVVLQDFQFVAEGQPMPDAGAASAPDAGDAGVDDDGGADAQAGSSFDAGVESSVDDAGVSPALDAGEESDAGSPTSRRGAGGCNAVGATGTPSGALAFLALGILAMAAVSRRSKRRGV